MVRAFGMRQKRTPPINSGIREGFLSGGWEPKKSEFQEVSNRTHWTDPEKTWGSNSLGVRWDSVPVNFWWIYSWYFTTPNCIDGSLKHFSRWWFLAFIGWTPSLGKISILTNDFQWGGSNYQLHRSSVFTHFFCFPIDTWHILGDRLDRGIFHVGPTRKFNFNAGSLRVATWRIIPGRT